jgi:hypothetical protein
LLAFTESFENEGIHERRTCNIAHVPALDAIHLSIFPGNRNPYGQKIETVGNAGSYPILA